jgi:2-oxoglutarate ferredoxin oxidoreductase subunit delta
VFFVVKQELMMVKHIVDQEKCRGCGDCVDNCSLELWVLVDRENGKGKIAKVTEEAVIVCHTCGMCSEGCPEKAIVIINEK